MGVLEDCQKLEPAINFISDAMSVMTENHTPCLDWTPNTHETTSYQVDLLFKNNSECKDKIDPLVYIVAGILVIGVVGLIGAGIAGKLK